jgi:hypothetical protein
MSLFIVGLDNTIVNIALPALRRELHTSISGLQWTIDAYTLVLASFLVLAGSIADRVGRRRVFQAGLAAFGLGSLLCGLAPGIGALIAARGLQAVGGTMLNPVAMAIIANTFPGPAERARAIGVFGSVSGLALALGPILGGALVDGFGWRAVFWVNVPIVAAAIVCTALFVPESRAARARRFDPVGQVLMVLLLGSVVYAIIESKALGWTSPVIGGLVAVAMLSAAGIAVYEPRRTGHPAARRASGLPAVRHLPGRRQPAHHQHGAVRDAPLDGRGGRLTGLGWPAGRHHPGRRDLRNDRGIGSVPRRAGVHRRGACRLVDGARARRRHRGPGAAQHRAPGPGHRRAGGRPVRRRGRRRTGRTAPRRPGPRPRDRLRLSITAARTLIRA